MILEAAIIQVRPGEETAFEEAFRQASLLISASPGCLSHELHRCLESGNRYLLLVRWVSLDAHTIGFRTSPAYQEWKKLLHHFYDPFPAVEHFRHVELRALPPVATGV